MSNPLLACASREIYRGVPDLIQVLPYGCHQTEKGPFLLDEEAALEVVRAFHQRVNDMVIDYEHQTLKGTEAPAAGWIKRLVDRGKGGIWAVVEWTERAKGYLQNREYRYISPVFLKRASDNRVVKLFNVALTNQPAIDEMVPVVNKLSANEISDYQLTTEYVNRLLGLSEGSPDELKQAQEMVCLKNSHTFGSAAIDGTQQYVNRLLGIDDETFKRYEKYL
jgi:phage I-like protein